MARCDEWRKEVLGMRYPRRVTAAIVPVLDNDYWRSVTDVPCPRCKLGIVRWAEAGHVPGYRICDRCGQGWFAGGNAARPILAPPVEKSPGCWGPAEEGEWADSHVHVDSGVVGLIGDDNAR